MDYDEKDPRYKLPAGDGIPGDTVYYLGVNGYPSDREHANEHFTVGQELVINDMDQGSCHTVYWFKDGPTQRLPGRNFDSIVGFNSVMFSTVKPKV